MRSPFLGSPKTEIVPVGNEQTGLVYLLKKHGISRNESPTDLENDAKSGAITTALILQAAKNYAAKHSITESAAKDLIFGRQKINVLECLEGSDKDQWQRLMGAIVDGYSAKNGLPKDEAQNLIFAAVGQPSVEVNVLDYLSREDSEKYLEISGRAQQLPWLATTVMMQTRLVHTLKIVGTVAPGSKTIAIEPAFFPADKGERLRVSLSGATASVQLVIAAPVVPGQEQIEVEPVDAEIPEQIGFLLGSDRKEKVGLPEWALADSNALLDEQVQAIYTFYESEKGGLVAAKTEAVTAKEGNSQSKLNDSGASLTPSLPTGTSSTGESSPTASVTLDLPPLTTSANSQNG
jgi:hypothetical protein